MVQMIFLCIFRYKNVNFLGCRLFEFMGGKNETTNAVCPPLLIVTSPPLLIVTSPPFCFFLFFVLFIKSAHVDVHSLPGCEHYSMLKIRRSGKRISEPVDIHQDQDGTIIVKCKATADKIADFLSKWDYAIRACK